MLEEARTNVAAYDSDELEDDGTGRFHQDLDRRRDEREVREAAAKAMERERERQAREGEVGDYDDSGDDENPELEEQRLLPRWQDPRLWQVKCKAGQENEVCDVFVAIQSCNSMLNRFQGLFGVI